MTELNSVVKTKFFTYRQNNSFGKWIGPQTIIVEALDIKHADTIAEDNEIYFNGCSEGIDCHCCGDRWYRQYDENDGYEVPSIWGEPVNPEEDKDVVIVYLNGRKITY